MPSGSSHVMDMLIGRSVLQMPDKTLNISTSLTGCCNHGLAVSKSLHVCLIGFGITLQLGQNLQSLGWCHGGVSWQQESLGPVHTCPSHSWQECTLHYVCAHTTGGSATSKHAPHMWPRVCMPQVASLNFANLQKESIIRTPTWSTPTS